MDCTGCFACRNICPRNAISVTEDNYGNSVPLIDEKKCISCNACSRVCPVIHNQPLRKAKEAYAVWSKNTEDIQYSSSGGVASVFSKRILQEKGIVVGVACQEQEVRHICIKEETEIKKLRGSKYVQSNVSLTYRDTKKNLIEGKKVIFFGTPCQIAGLKSFLGKEYDDLITVDLICHGTPPIKYLKEHINNKLKNKSWSHVTFRGEYDFVLTVYNQNKIVYQREAKRDEYFKAFLDSMTYRNCCYTCKYACVDRVADITIGDFWGINRESLSNSYSGKISLVLPNTEKGKKYFEQCLSEFVWEIRPLSEALNPQQGNLLHPSIPHSERESFLCDYRKKGFEKSVKHTIIGREVWNANVKYMVKKLWCVKILVKIKRIVKNRGI